MAHYFLLFGCGNNRKPARAHRGCLLSNQFNAGSIHNGQQFFGDGFRGGQKAGAHASRWNYNRGDSGGGIFAFISHGS